MSKNPIPPPNHPSRIGMFERGKRDASDANAEDHEALREWLELLTLKPAATEINTAMQLEGSKQKLGALKAYAVLTLVLAPDEFINCVAAQYADKAEQFMMAFAVEQQFMELLQALRKGKTWVAIMWFERGLGVTAGEARHAN